MIKRKRKAFTIVELVIVIAVIAVLAAVLIPTFSSIIQKANESADIQAVRQMNMALMAESAVAPPETLEEVVRILAAAGYNAKDKLVPVSTDHGFYWCSEVNLISLIKDKEGSTPELIFPLDNQALKDAVTAAASDWAGALAATDPIFYDLGEKAEEILEKIEQEVSAGGGITSADELKKALEAGGTIQLGGNIIINEAITISKEATIDLAGYTLTIDKLSEDSDVISVSGNLIITGEGNIAIDNESYDFAGICVNEGGTLKLENVSIEGHTKYNIKNYGTISLDNTSLTVNFGWGLFNFGDATITNGEFVANGEQVLPISNGGDYYTGGTVKITGTKFSEGSSFVSYCSGSIAPIYSYQGAITLAEVTVTTGADIPNVSAWSGASVTVESGTFNDKFMCVSSSVTVKGGTFGDKTFAELYDEATTSDDAVKAALCCYDGWTLTRADNVITLTRN